MFSLGFQNFPFGIQYFSRIFKVFHFYFQVFNRMSKLAISASKIFTWISRLLFGNNMFLFGNVMFLSGDDMFLFGNVTIYAPLLARYICFHCSRSKQNGSVLDVRSRTCASISHDTRPIDMMYRLQWKRTQPRRVMKV